MGSGFDLGELRKYMEELGIWDKVQTVRTTYAIANINILTLFKTPIKSPQANFSTSVTLGHKPCPTKSKVP
jgi:hypothetical protein